MEGFTTRRVRTRWGELAVDRWDGGGAPLLLLHGIPGWRGTWREVARRLAPGFRVAAPDLLGFGESDPAPATAHAREHAESLAALLDALGWDEVHVAAHDFGGPSAVLLAAMLPTRVRSLVLCATNLFPDTPVPFPLRIARVPVLGAVAFRLAFGRAGLTAMWRAACGDRSAFPLARYRDALASARGVASTRRIFRSSLRDLEGLYGPVARAASALRVPSAAIWGDRDPFFPARVGERTARAIGGGFHLLAGCGHFVPDERPEDVARVIRDTVAAARGPSAARS